MLLKGDKRDACRIFVGGGCDFWKTAVWIIGIRCSGAVCAFGT